MSKELVCKYCGKEQHLNGQDNDHRWTAECGCSEYQGNHRKCNKHERSEEPPCYCAEINFRNCPRHQNSEESAVQEGVAIGKSVVESMNDIKLREAIQAERTRMIKALEGLTEVGELNKSKDDFFLGWDEKIARGYRLAIDQAIKAVEKGNK